MDTSLTFTSNRLFDTFRTVERAGKQWLVVNGVPLVEGVLNGRFVPADEFGSFVNDWNDIPVVLPHPKRNGGSARVPDPDVPVVGRFYNAKMDGNRLVGEYWLDKALLESLRDNDGNQDAGLVLERIDNKQEVETSTGYWSESVPRSGNFKGRKYSYVDQKIHPDHIALLTQEAGACSLADGCGMNRNRAMYQNAVDGTYEKRMSDIQMAFDETMRLRDKRASKLGSETDVPVSNYWIEGTKDTFVIARKGSELFKVGYTYNESNGKVFFDDESEWVPVIKEERYVERIVQNVTGSLPAEGKTLWESVYEENKDKGEERAAQIAWGAVRKAGWEKDKDGKWHKKSTKQNQQDLEGLAVALSLLESAS
jgi:hypothetical protein